MGNIISGFLVFIGLPMLLPAINLLQSNENNVINNDLISEFTKKLYNHLNIDFTFFNVVLFSSTLIISSYIVLILIELYQKKSKLVLSKEICFKQ